MHSLTRSMLLGFFFCLGLAAFANAQDDAAFAPEDDQETLGEFRARIREAEQASRQQRATEKTAQEATETIVAQPSTPTSAGGFGSRVEDSLTDFLPFFDFAVDAIDTADDQESVTVSFSPVRLGTFGEIDLTAKISKPEPFESLLNEIPEAARSAQSEAITKRIDDFSDVLWTATYGLQWKVERNWSDAPRMLFGRHPGLYESLIHELMGELWPKVFDAIPEATGKFLSSCQDEFVEKVAAGSDLVNVDALTAQAVKDALATSSRCPWNRYVEALVLREQQLAAADQVLADAPIDQLAAMIDNQPQLTLTAALRDRDPLVGQDETSATLKLELGTRNLNTALRQYRRAMKRHAAGIPGAPAPSAAAALEKVAEEPYDKKNKLVLALEWRQREAYMESYDFVEKVTDPASGSEVEIPRTVSLDLQERDEWCGRFQLSRSLPGQAFMQEGIEVVPRIEGALEYVHVQGDPMRQNRFVARLSYLLPGPKGMTLPFTVTWADKSEFLGEQDHVFGAHLGISYKLGNPDGSSN